MLSAAWNDPFGAYAYDGDARWTLALVREWWADRERIAAWLQVACRSLSASERDNASGLRDYASHLGDGLEDYLRQYGFWLDNHRAAIPGETLPDLVRRLRAGA